MKNKDVKLIAHRGLSSQATENTVEAFLLAAKADFYGIECDVHFTLDNEMIINHDHDTSRLSNSNLELSKNTYHDLRNVALYNLNGEPNNDLYMPLLNEYLEICKQYNKVAVIELKTTVNEKELKQVLELIDFHNIKDQVIIISFHLDNLVLLRKKDTNIKAQYLRGEFSEEILEQCQLNQIDIDIHYGAVTKKIVEQFHELGLQVNVWTVNDIKTYEKMVEFGVDFITTNGI